MTPPADIYLQVQDSLLTRLLTYTEAPGREGVALPYTLREDDGITVLVLLCAFLLVVAVPRSARFLSSQLRNIFSTRERSSLFADEAHVDSRYRLMLTLHTCVVAGVLAFSCLEAGSAEWDMFRRAGWLCACIGLAVFAYVSKYVSYLFVNWIFFDKSKQRPWLEAYSSVFIVEGLLLFPILLSSVYFDLSSGKVLFLSCLAFAVGRIMLFCKCAGIFFRKIHRAFYLIVYFCALEIVPCLLISRTLMTISSLHNKILGL